MSISQTIFTHKKIAKALRDNNIYTLQHGGGGIVVILHISGARAIFLLLCDHQDIEYE